MVTERVITLPTEPTQGVIVKSHPLFSFINIGQRGRKACLMLKAYDKIIVCCYFLNKHINVVCFYVWLVHVRDIYSCPTCKVHVQRYNIH